MSHKNSTDSQTFERENGALHTIIAELLVVNQELRWKLAWRGGFADENRSPGSTATR